MASKPSESKAEGPATDSQVQVEKEIVASVYPEIVHHEFQNQCLIKLKKEQEKLRNDFLNRQKLIKELELQKQEKECNFLICLHFLSVIFYFVESIRYTYIFP